MGFSGRGVFYGEPSVSVVFEDDAALLASTFPVDRRGNAGACRQRRVEIAEEEIAKSVDTRGIP